MNLKLMSNMFEHVFELQQNDAMCLLSHTSIHLNMHYICRM